MWYLFRRNAKLVRILVVSAIISLFVLLFVISNINSKSMPLLKPHLHDNITWCYKPSVRNSIRYFDDIADSPKQPQHGKAIFFHETTCSTNGIVKLNSKQACAIESAALRNPNRDIFVLFASPVGLKITGTLPQFVDILGKYDNIHFRNINLWRYSIDTPIYKWFQSDKMFESAFLFEHMSDILRAITLYRYGGFYMDLDVIVQKNVDGLGDDFVGDDWSEVVNGAVLHLNNYGIGKRVADTFLRDIQEKFKGAEFTANGPLILTQIFEEICSSKDRKQWTKEQCSGLFLQPKENLYPISWSDFNMYFDPSKLTETLKRTKNATVIHVWNDLSRSIWNPIGTNNAYQVIAKKNCPNVYLSSDYL